MELDRTEITGTKGRLIFPSFKTTPIILETADGRQEVAEDWPEHVAQPLIQTVVDELLGKDACPSTGHSAARTNWVVDEIYREFRALI